MQTSELRVGGARNRSDPVVSVPSFNVIPALVFGTRSVDILPTRMMEVAPG